MPLIDTPKDGLLDHAMTPAEGALTPAQPKSEALRALYWRDEILQVMFWLRGEGFGDDADAPLIERFRGVWAGLLVPRLGRRRRGLPGTTAGSRGPHARGPHARGPRSRSSRALPRGSRALLTGPHPSTPRLGVFSGCAGCRKMGRFRSSATGWGNDHHGEWPKFAGCGGTRATRLQ